MQQPAGQYSNGGFYPPADPPYSQTFMASYGSAPPYTASPSFYSENPSHQSAPQAPPYLPPQQLLADSMASLNISGSYSPLPPAPAGQAAPPSASYTPTVPSYEQSYGAGASTVPPSLIHRQSIPSQPPNYSSAAGFPDAPPYPQAGYDPSPSSLIGSYSPNLPSKYEPAPSLMGPYDASNQHMLASKQGYDSPVSGTGSGYGANQPGTQGYDSPLSGIGSGNEANQPGTQGYDYPSSGQLGVYSHGSRNYGAQTHSRDYDRPSYSPAAAYDGNYYEKLTGQDRAPGKNAYDFDDANLGEVYAYDGGNVEPYGARGTGTGGSWTALDNYGSGSFNAYGSSGTSSKLPKAVPKVENESKSGGVPKYQVKVLSDGSSGGPQNVLCQIGLDGVRMISPSNNKTVRIYPLETITRWEVSEPSVFTFWAKSAVDPEPRRIRLQSGSYTTNAILDTLTAACVQFSEMVDKVDSSKVSTDVDKSAGLSLEKRKPLIVNWISLRNKQLAPEEKQHWVPDEAVTKCSSCSSDFGPFLRRHHCRNCGDVFCDKCTNGRTALTADEDAPVVRVCDRCLAEVTQRLSNAKEISSKPVSAPHTHEDLAKKLQEEMERNSSKRSTTDSSSTGGKERSGQTNVLNCSACGSISLVNGSSTRCPACGLDVHSGRDSSRGSSWSSSDGSSKRMREVACPTCTVHLQVQVPSSGTETVECGVCQHPFLVSAH